MLFKHLILMTLSLHIKTLVSAMLAKFAYSLDVRKLQGFFLTLLAT